MGTDFIQQLMGLIKLTPEAVALEASVSAAKVLNATLNHCDKMDRKFNKSGLTFAHIQSLITFGVSNL